MKIDIAVLAGDGIGPEVVRQALRVLRAVGEKFQHEFSFSEGLIGGAAYENYGMHLPAETIEICQDAKAIFFGSVGGPVKDLHLDKWRNCERECLLGLRKTFQFNANIRPVEVHPYLSEICPLKPEVIAEGINMMIIRELVGDIYFGAHERSMRDGKRVATDVAEYTEDQISSVAHIAFQAARKRRKKVSSVDKANVLETSRLWREVVREVSKEYADVELEEVLVDNCAMQLIIKPSQFDVILASNMFGDILSDAAAVLPGSLGLLASASMNAEGFGMYEPPGGSAQDIAGKGIANPTGQILSAAMMLKYGFGLMDESNAIEQAVAKTFHSGLRTRDVYRQAEGTSLVGTVEFADAVITNI